MPVIAYLPKPYQLDTGSNLRAGAKAYWYVTNTSTPKNTYSDFAMTTPNTNPVIADANGIFPVMFLATDQRYRLTLKDSADALIYTQDDIAGPVVTQAEVGAALYPQTAAELAAGVTPTNYAFAPTFFDPRRYGAIGDGSTDDATALQNALTVAGVNGGTVRIPYGLSFKSTSNLTVPVGSGTIVDIEGSGWANGGILFSGSGVTTGLTFSGSSYSYAGAVRNLRIRGTSSAVRGVTFTDCNHPRISRCFITGFAGAGAAFLGTLMGVLEHTLFTSCGSATEGTVEVDRSGSIATTTFKWDHSRISGGDTTVGGLVINRLYNFIVLGGAIESCGVPLRIAHKSDSTVGVKSGSIIGIDLENPGNGNPYIEIGQGLSSVFASNIKIQGCNGSPSGTTTVPYAIHAYRTLGCRVGQNNWSLASGTSFHELESSGNLGFYVESHRNLFASSGPAWVRVNGASVKAAGSQVDWQQGNATPGLSGDVSMSGTTFSVLYGGTQGGYYSLIVANNGGATTMTALTDGEKGMQIVIRAANGNTTLTHGTTADLFNMAGGANKTLTSGKMYPFTHNGTCWVHTGPDV